MKTIEISGDTYKLEGRPSMGVVKHVQSMQIDILRDYLSDKQIMEMGSMSEDEVMKALVDSEGGVDNLKDLMWKNNLLSTAQSIILATNHKFDLSEFDHMDAVEFMRAKEAAEEALGSEENPMSAEDFMSDLGLNTSSRMRELQREAERRLEEGDSETSSQSPLLTE